MFGAAPLVLATWALMTGCREPEGPYPTVTLRIEGTVTDADNPGVGVAGATVELRHFKGLLTDPETLSRASTDGNGYYTLTYSFTSVCTAEEDTLEWLEAVAEGYDTLSTLVPFRESSAPPIYCTGKTQVINLSLKRSSAG